MNCVIFKQLTVIRAKHLHKKIARNLILIKKTNGILLIIEIGRNWLNLSENVLNCEKKICYLCSAYFELNIANFLYRNK